MCVDGQTFGYGVRESVLGKFIPPPTHLLECFRFSQRVFSLAASATVFRFPKDVPEEADDQSELF